MDHRPGHFARLLVRFVLPLTVGLAGVVACGPSAGAIVLTLDPGSAELRRAAPVHVEVTIVRQVGATAAVTLTATGLPTDVTVVFDPAVLSGDQSTSTATFNAGPTAPHGAHAVTVTGAGPGLRATAELELDVNNVTVTGHVGYAYGRPAEGVAVASQGLSGLIDAEGAFELIGLAVPYDLTVYNVADLWAHVYQGLSAVDPRLVPDRLISLPADTYQATVSGTISGAVPPVLTAQKVYVCLGGLDVFLAICDVVEPPDDAYSIPAYWDLTSTTQARLVALQVEYGIDGQPLSYPAYAAFDVSLNDGLNTVADVVLGAGPATSTLTVEIDTTTTLSRTNVGVQFGPHLHLPVYSDTSGATSFSVLVPEPTGTTRSVVAYGSTEHVAWHSDSVAAAVVLSLPDPPALSAPADGATGVTTSTPFEVDGWDDRPLTHLWAPTVLGPHLAVTTSGGVVTLPDLSALDLPLPPDSVHEWSVAGGAGPDTDAVGLQAANYVRTVLASVFLIPTGPSGEGIFALSETRSFTTAP